ncbi:MAG: hypothetical protein J1F28_01750 [Oscillospiraceae bacterium]|nr:hypothetical protein [Oscillospiraceae bacterium]
MSAINEFCDVKDDITKVLRESISEVLDPNMNGSVLAAQMDAVLERLEQEDFKLTEYDDIAVRQIIEKVTVNDKVTITVTFKGGVEIRKML